MILRIIRWPVALVGIVKFVKISVSLRPWLSKEPLSNHPLILNALSVMRQWYFEKAEEIKTNFMAVRVSQNAGELNHTNNLWGWHLTWEMLGVSPNWQVKNPKHTCWGWKIARYTFGRVVAKRGGKQCHGGSCLFSKQLWRPKPDWVHAGFDRKGTGGSQRQS